MPDVVPLSGAPVGRGPGDPACGPGACSAALPTAGRVLGLDLGARRIGVAVSDSGRRVATGLTALSRQDPDTDLRRIGDLVAEYEAAGVIVGMPLSLSGQPGPAARAATAEVERLRLALSVPVDTIDERLTTVQAAAGLRAGGRRARNQRSVIDQQAAAELLQTWLERQRAGAR